MNIKALTIGHAVGKKAAYGIMLSTDDKPPANLSIARLLIGDYNKNQAGLIAILMAIRAIKPEFHSSNITLCTHGYAYQVMERGDTGWVMAAQSNIELVNAVRDAVLKFPNLRIQEISLDDETYNQCKKLAKAACTI